MSKENELFLRFVTSVFTPLQQAVDAGEARPQDVLDVIARIMDLLRRLESSLPVEAKSLNTQLTQPVPPVPRAPADGVSLAPLEAWLKQASRFPPRQRSIARQIEILWLLEDVNGAIVLSRLHDHVVTLGLSESGGQAAVVTQISRMKKLGFVHSEAHGLYSRTDAGADELSRLRKNYASLRVPDEVRKMVAVR